MTATKHISGDNFESNGGSINIAKDHGTAIQTNNTLTQQSSVDEIMQLLCALRQELSNLPLPQDVKDEALNEVAGAEIQAKKPQPDKQKIAAKLKNAATALEESVKTVQGAVTLGKLLGQAILWCGAQWTSWA